MDTVKKQDMPPEGGYKRIPFIRNPARSYFSGFQIFGAYVGITTVGLYLYYLTAKEMRMRDIEIRSSRFAIHPVLLAERDRSYLKDIRKLRDEEADLMKNVEGWKVGTWYGERVFRTKPATELIDPSFAEMYVHTQYKHWAKRAHLELYS